MRISLLVFVVPVLLLASLLVRAQEKDSQPDPFQRLVARMPEEARREYERLRKAQFASLELLPRSLEGGESPDKLKEHYKAGDKIYFRLLITNNSIDKVVFSSSDSYQEQRPLLFRDGDEVPYRKSVAELLPAKDKEIMERSYRAAPLEAGQTRTEYVELTDWYEPIQAGHYQLTVRRRFIWGGDWIDSKPITFEVDPQPTKTGREK
jgi:hypothetical protein